MERSRNYAADRFVLSSKPSPTIEYDGLGYPLPQFSQRPRTISAFEWFRLTNGFDGCKPVMDIDGIPWSISDADQSALKAALNATYSKWKSFWSVFDPFHDSYERIVERIKAEARAARIAYIRYHRDDLILAGKINQLDMDAAASAKWLSTWGHPIL